VKWNPLAGIVQGYRERLLTSNLPSLNELLLLSAVAISVFIAGGLFFRQLKRGFADVL
jgi:lipopolysaccharide transport system permease protein